MNVVEMAIDRRRTESGTEASTSAIATAGTSLVILHTPTVGDPEPETKEASLDIGRKVRKYDDPYIEMERSSDDHDSD